MQGCALHVSTSAALVAAIIEVVIRSYLPLPLTSYRRALRLRSRVISLPRPPHRVRVQHYRPRQVDRPLQSTVQPSAPQPNVVVGTTTTVSLGPVTTSAPTTAPSTAPSTPSSSIPSLSLPPLIPFTPITPTPLPPTSQTAIPTTTPSSGAFPAASSSPLSTPPADTVVSQSTNVPVVTPVTSVPTAFAPSSIPSAPSGSTTPVLSVTPVPSTSPVPVSAATTTSLSPTVSATTTSPSSSPSASASVTPYPLVAATQTPKLSGTLIAIITTLSFLALLSLALGAFLFARARRQRIARIQRQRELTTRALTYNSSQLVRSSYYGGNTGC
ncbi:hypothetical protein BU15DRAFT_72043 [Melanogaster broomeanus]|nr:hypothetical protein BU15DRAFT_72043 [Melanogaster broomeanus]